MHTVILMKWGFLLQFIRGLERTLQVGILKSLRCPSNSSSVVLALQGSAYEQGSAPSWTDWFPDKALPGTNYKLVAWKGLKHSAW